MLLVIVWQKQYISNVQQHCWYKLLANFSVSDITLSTKVNQLTFKSIMALVSLCWSRCWRYNHCWRCRCWWQQLPFRNNGKRRIGFKDMTEMCWIAASEKAKLLHYLLRSTGFIIRDCRMQYYARFCSSNIREGCRYRRSGENVIGAL